MGKYPVAVTAVVFNSNNEFLLLKNRRFGVWILPGGAMEKDEDVMGCLCRELREELGEAQIEILGTAEACSFTVEDIRFVGLTFVGTYLGGNIDLSDEHDAYRWTRLDEVESGEYSPTHPVDTLQRAAKLYPFLTQF